MHNSSNSRLVLTGKSRMLTDSCALSSNLNIIDILREVKEHFRRL